MKENFFVVTSTQALAELKSKLAELNVRKELSKNYIHIVCILYGCMKGMCSFIGNGYYPGNYKRIAS